MTVRLTDIKYLESGIEASFAFVKTLTPSPPKS